MPTEPSDDRSATSYFRDQFSDDTTGTTRELLVSARPHARLEFRVLLETPQAKATASYSLARYRVRALVHMLHGWLGATAQDDDEPPSPPPPVLAPSLAPVPFRTRFPWGTLEVHSDGVRFEGTASLAPEQARSLARQILLRWPDSPRPER